MKLENKILNYLNSNDNGEVIDITFIDEDYSTVNQVVDELRGRNFIVVDNCSSRDFEAFGISNQRKRCVRAKINTNGKVYLHSLNMVENKPEKEIKRSWKAYLLNSF
ncbi:MAG: hypothetical protein L3J08_00480 [Flavobacteriaceae bacterium]|nr:hypothetical protein [Flavobacteriaceae bacterium]